MKALFFSVMPYRGNFYYHAKMWLYLVLNLIRIWDTNKHLSKSTGVRDISTLSTTFLEHIFLTNNENFVKNRYCLGKHLNTNRISFYFWVESRQNETRKCPKNTEEANALPYKNIHFAGCCNMNRTKEESYST